MAIRVVCKCGRTLNAPDEAVGKQGKCPGCGNRLVIAADEAVLLTEVSPEMPLGFSLELGSVQCSYAKLKFSFHVDRAQCAYVQVVAISDYGDDDDDNQIVVCRLDDDRYAQLLTAMTAMQDIVTKYRKSGAGKRMVEVFGNRD
jgi:hypothetical protein